MKQTLRMLIEDIHVSFGCHVAKQLSFTTWVEQLRAMIPRSLVSALMLKVLA